MLNKKGNFRFTYTGVPTNLYTTYYKIMKV